MQTTRLLLATTLALGTGGCLNRSAPSYTMVDPNTGQQYVVVQPPQQMAQPTQYASPGFELYGQGGQPVYAQAPPAAPPPPPQQQTGGNEIPNRGLFTASNTPLNSSYAYAPPQQQPYVVQYQQPYPQPPQVVYAPPPAPITRTR
jgi:hypothetical protein